MLLTPREKSLTASSRVGPGGVDGLALCDSRPEVRGSAMRTTTDVTTYGLLTVTAAAAPDTAIAAMAMMEAIEANLSGIEWRGETELALRRDSDRRARKRGRTN